MTDKTRIRIGAGVTVLFLAGISAAGLAARDGQPPATATAARPPATLPAPDGAAPGEGAESGGALDAALSALAGVLALDDDEGAEHDDDAARGVRGR